MGRVTAEIVNQTLGVPLVVGDEARGVIALENIDRENAFSESDLRLLSTLASLGILMNVAEHAG